MRHAPRGRIKARRPDEASHPVKDPLRCSATNRQGKQCGKAPIRGGTVCRMHGGGAPQVRRAAELRLEALRPKAVRYLDWLVSQREYPSAGLGAAKDLMDRVDGKAIERVDMRMSGSVTLEGRVAAARKRLSGGGDGGDG